MAKTKVKAEPRPATKPRVESKPASKRTADQAERTRHPALPPSNGRPGAARAAELVAGRASPPDRARMTAAMQRAAGNARTGAMLGGLAPAEPASLGPGQGAAPDVTDVQPVREGERHAEGIEAEGIEVETAEIPERGTAPGIEAAMTPSREAPADDRADERVPSRVPQRTVAGLESRVDVGPLGPEAGPQPGTPAEATDDGEKSGTPGRAEKGAEAEGAAEAAEAAEPESLDTKPTPEAEEDGAEGRAKGEVAKAEVEGKSKGEAEAKAKTEPEEKEGGAQADAPQAKAVRAEAAGGEMAATPEGGGGGAPSAVPSVASVDAEGGGDEEAAADELEDKLEAAAPNEPADEEAAVEEPGPEPELAPEPEPAAPVLESSGDGESDTEQRSGPEPAALNTPAAEPAHGPETAEAAELEPLSGPSTTGAMEISEGEVEGEQAELSPAEKDAAMAAMAEAGGGEPSGGGAGGGAAVPEKPPAETPDVSSLEPQAALATAGSAPPAQLSAALGGVKAAVGKDVGEKKAEMAANPPTVERPAGKGAKSPETPKAGQARKVEKAKEGQEKPTPPPESVPDPSAPPPVDAVPSPPVQSTPEGELTEDDARRMKGSISSMPTSDPGLNAKAGPPPQVRLEGSADPAQVDEQKAKLAESADKTRVEGKADAAAYMGERDVFDDQPAQTLAAPIGGGEAGAAGSVPGSGPGGGGGAGAEAGAASIIAQEEKGGEIAAAVTAAKAEMAAKKQEHVAKVSEEKSKSKEEISGLEKENAKEQDAVRASAKADVAKKRGEWTSEQDTAIKKANADADTEVKAGRKKVDDEKRTADDKARQEIRKGDDEAAKERRKAEREAKEKKRQAKKKSSGFFGWLASKAKAFFNKIKSAIKAAFEAARKLVKAAINKAKELAAKAIEMARKTIVAAIKAVGAALIAIGDRLLAAFPALRDKFRKAIQSAVNKAVDTVNKLAEKLNKAIQKALDMLGAALDAALGLLEKGLLAAVDVVASVVDGALKLANSIVQALAAFARLIVDIAAGPIQWLKNLGAGVIDGIRNHLWKAFKAAVQEWFNSKVQQVVGLGAAVWNLLVKGGITVAQIGKMAWEGIKAMIPTAVIQILVEKLVSMLVPAAGAVKVIIEGLQAAWGSISRILQAFSKFFAFLKAVRPGAAGPPFASAVAAAAIAVIDFIANWLLQKLAKGAKKVGGKLKGIARRLKSKKRAKVARKKAKAAAKKPKPGAKPTPVPRPKPKPRSKQKQARKDKKEKVRERKKQERLARAQRELPPKINPLLRKGVNRVALGARLAAWRLKYRLHRLTFEPQGNRRVLIAAASPGVRITDSLRIDRAKLLKMIKDIGKEVYKHEKSGASGRQIKSLVAGAQTEVGSTRDPVDISGHGLPGAARYFAERKPPPWFSQQVFQLGGPDTLARAQQFGTPVISGATARDTAGFGRVPLGSTQDIGESLSAVGDPQLVGQGLRAAARGRLIGGGGVTSTRIAASALWMFGLEGARNRSSLVTGAMIAQLMERGMDPRDAMKLFPMGPKGAVATSREVDDFIAQRTTYLTMSPGAREMTTTEVKLVQTWVGRVVQGKELADEEALRAEIREQVLRFFALRPDQLRRRA